MNVLDWDTAFFGVQVGRAGVEESLSEARAAAEAAGVECLYLERAAAHPAAIAEAVLAGALLVDLRLGLSLEGVPVGNGHARLVATGEAERLADSAVRLSDFSRFRADPRFPPERVHELYRRWLGRCLEEGVVVVPPDGRSGFVGARVEDGVALVELVWVDPGAAGGGTGRALVAAALAHLEMPRARVVTQAGNVPAQRLYQSLGFRTDSCTAILHLWLPASP